MRVKPSNRILSVLLALIMVLGMFPVTAFAAEEVATWEKVDFADIESTDTIAIVTNASFTGTAYVLRNDGGTSIYGPASKWDSTVTGDSTWHWNIVAVDGGYMIYPAGKTSEWLYCTDNNNGLRVGGGDIETVWNLDGDYLKCVDPNGNARWMGVYDNNGGAAITSDPNFRTYKNTTNNTKNQTTEFYKLTGTGSSVDPEDPIVPEEPAEPKTLTIAEANAIGSTLAKNEETPEKYLVTGTVTEIINTTYGNFYIEDANGDSIYVYGCYDKDGANRYDAMETKPQVGDTVTVLGVVSFYNAPQLKNVWVQEIIPAPKTLTIAEAVAMGEALAHNTVTEDKYLVTGTVAEISNTTYGNLYLEDAEGNRIYVYGCYDKTGDVRFDKMDPQPAVGDTVTVLGVVSNYNGPQLKNVWVQEITAPAPEAEYAEKMFELPGNGDVVIIYNSGKAMGSAASGSRLAGIDVTVEDDELAVTEEMAQLTVSEEDGVYVFTLDGKYLTSGATGNSMSFADELTDCGKWTIEAAVDGAWYIRNVGANYNGNYNQAMEYYNGFTTYGIKETEIYQMQFFAVSVAPVEPEVVYGEKAYELPGNGDVVIIYNSGKAMGSAASGSRLAGIDVTVEDDKLAVTEEMAQLTVSEEDGVYVFTLDGKYLTSGATGNSMSFADELTDCGKWTIEAAVDGAWYIRNVGANYNGNYNQAMEYYNGFTTYGIKETEIYQMQFFVVEKAAEEPAEGGKLTSAEEFESGYYVMVVETGYAPLALNGNWVTTIQPTIENGVVTDAQGAVWYLEVDGDKVTITDDAGQSIAPKGGNTNGIAAGDYAWEWSFNEAKETFTFKGTGSDTVTFASNASEDATYGGFHRFRAYKNTTVSGNPAGYPSNFSLYKYVPSETGNEIEEGDEVLIYNLDAEGVLGAEGDNQVINNVLLDVYENEAGISDGAVVFTVQKNGEWYRFYNESYGYLCSTGTGNNAFYSKEASDDADWKLLTGKKGGYNLESRTAKFNGSYSQYLEYYGDSYKTYSMYNVTNYDIYEFFFYPVNEAATIIGGLVSSPEVIWTYDEAYYGRDWEVTAEVISCVGHYNVKYYVSDDFNAVIYEIPEENVEINGNIYRFTVPAETVNAIYEGQTVPEGEFASINISFEFEIAENNGFTGGAGSSIIDEPSIGEVSPAANAETKEEKRPEIRAEIINAGENPTVTMTVNDAEVEAVYEDGFVSYVPAEDMADGRTTVTVKVTREDGKEVTKTWTFTVGEAQYQLYFGQLHSHTTYSDGSGSLEAALDYIGNLPDSANVDFVAFTDHSNYFDSSSAANPESALYDMDFASASSQKTWNEYKSAVEEFNNSQSDVVALGGFEMTWSGGPGHMNTFNTPGIVSRNNSTLNSKTNDAGMKAYYALLSQPEGADSLNQFNHPGSTFGTFADFAYWDALIDTRIQMVEVGNGEGQVGAGGYYPSYEYYTMALDKGWHVAPTNNQDNHKGKWGNANDARNVILTDNFSEEGIYQALRDMRMYATEDKNLELYYTVNGLQLGSSIVDVPEKLNLSVNFYDPDASDSVSKVEVIVNSGKVAYTWDNQAELATGKLTAELDPDYSYYYIRVTQGDGDLAVTAPVWVGEALKLGISSVQTATTTPVTDEELTLTTTLFNSESSVANVKALTYQIKGGEVIGTDTNGYTVPASGTGTVEFKWTPTEAKVTVITVTAVVEQGGNEYTFTMDIELDVQDADKLVYVGIDASHYNEYVNGNYKDNMGNFTNLAAGYNVRTVTLYKSEDLIAACSNPKYKALILTAPSRRSSEAQNADPLKVYTEAELEAIAAFNNAGGTVILAGWSDHYENYPSVESIANMKAEEHMAATQNAVLEALGSSLRIGDDATYDDDHNGGQAYRLYFNSYDFDSFLVEGVEVDEEHPHDRLYTEVFSHYGGASVYTVDGTLPETVTPVVFGHSGTYSVDVDKDGLGGASMTKYEYKEGDNRLMIMAQEQLEGKGLIIVSGAAFMSNFEVQATIEDSGAEKNYSNYKICENLLAYINPAQVTDIADVRAVTEAGYKFTIEGVVTSNASGYDKETAFFDCIYVQDATGGICCFPVAGNYKIGDKVRITGTTEFYQGEPELQVSSIEIIGEGNVEAKEISAAELNSREFEGQLITVSGVVESVELANVHVQTIMVKDENGDLARVFIDGYITTDKFIPNLVKGAKISVTGLASYDDTFNAPEGPFQRIRVRNRDDVVCSVVPGDANGDGEVTSRDATRILQYLVDMLDGKEIALEAADFNGDGVVTSRDATAILRHLTNL